MKKVLLAILVGSLVFVAMKEFEVNPLIAELDVLLFIGSVVVFKKFWVNQLSWFLS